METLTELVAKISADATELKKALAESEKDVQGLGKNIEKETKSWQEQFKAVGKVALGMGASITAAMTGAVMSFTKTGSELHDLSLKTGVSAKALAGLKYAAEQNGASLGTVEMAIRRVAMAMSDATSATSASGKAFARLGITLTDLQGLDPEQQFLKIASAIASVSDPMTRAALAVDLFGRSGTDMLPMLSEGANGLRRMMEEGQRLTGWTDAGAMSADAFGDSIGTLKTAMSGLFNTIGTALTPALTDLSNKITGLISNFKEWADIHPVLVQQLTTLTTGVGLFLVPLGTLMLLLPQIISSFYAFSFILGALAVNPVALLIAGIVGLTLVLVGLNAVTDAAAQKIDFASGKMTQADNNLKIMTGSLSDFGTELDSVADKISNVVQMTLDWNALWGGGGGKGGAYEKATGYEGWVMSKEIGTGRNLGYQFTHYGEAAPQGTFQELLPQYGTNPFPDLPEFAGGGIVPGQPGESVPIIAHGGEVVSTAGGGNITINFTQPVFFDREDTLNKFVGMIRKGIQRQDRLRFGGAYSG